jgi:regulator of sigma D
MKNLFGGNMNNELFDKIEDAFVKEARLVQRLNSFMFEYNHFEYDEMGINMEEAEEVKKRVEKIHNKLMNNVSSILDFTLKSKNIDILHHKVDLTATIQEEKQEDEETIIVKKDIDFSVIVDEDGFELEIVKDNSDEDNKTDEDTTSNE